jgi:hypothetical protein
MQYQSPFADWYTYSTVHKPLSDFTCEAGLVLFPPELVPGIGHPLVEKLGNTAKHRLMMRKLESYNTFTESLEYNACSALAADCDAVVQPVLEALLCGQQDGGDRIRVTAQLVEAETGSQVWAERYDRDIADIFAVQDEITEAVTIAIAPAIANAEQQRAMRKPPGSLDAWAAH